VNNGRQLKSFRQHLANQCRPHCGCAKRNQNVIGALDCATQETAIANHGDANAFVKFRIAVVKKRNMLPFT
jgi:hypothetical protein